MARLNREQFDELEREVDILGTRDVGAITDHYQRLRSWQIMISDLEAWNFGSTEFFVLLSVTGSLLVSTRTGNIPLELGSIIGMFTYCVGAGTIPYTVQRLGALKDILRRVSEAQPGTFPA